MESSVYLRAQQEWDERYADVVLDNPKLADRGGWLDCSQPDSRCRHRLAQHSEPIRFLRGRGRWQTTKIVK